MPTVELSDIQKFLTKASAKTYAGDAPEVENPKRPGFKELVYEEGDFFYRDSYTGHIRSRGTELIRFKGQPVWTSSYGGGMVNGKESLDYQTFAFLKKAFLARTGNSVRGPDHLDDDDWKYAYKQDGTLEEFSGYEEIYFQEELVFYHRAIGGLIV